METSGLQGSSKLGNESNVGGIPKATGKTPQLLRIETFADFCEYLPVAGPLFTKEAGRTRLSQTPSYADPAGWPWGSGADLPVISLMGDQ